MYIPPFWCGVIIGAVVTAILFIAWAVYCAKKGG